MRWVVIIESTFTKEIKSSFEFPMTKHITGRDTNNTMLHYSAYYNSSLY